MKRLLSVALLGTSALAFTGVLAGCHGSVDVDKPATSNSDTSYKKETVRDANGNVVSQTVEKKSN